MKHLTLLLVAISLFVLGCGQRSKISEGRRDNESDSENWPQPTEIEIGMSKDAVSELLSKFGAKDISSGMQGTGDAPKSNWMWSIDPPKLSIETLFENNKLATINVWDWRKQENDQLPSHDEIRSSRLVVAQCKRDF